MRQKIVIFAIALFQSTIAFAAKSTQECEAELGTQDRRIIAKCIDDSNKPTTLISSLQISDIDSAGGVEVSMQVTNVLGKPIKYINLTVNAFNAVADNVSYDALGRRRPARLSLTGPIAPGESDVYSWERIWYSSTAKCVSIESVEVIYMNNTKQLLRSNDARLANNKCR